MDYLCAEFGDLSFSLACFNMQKDRRTDRQTDATKRFTRVTVVSMSLLYCEELSAVLHCR